MKVKGRNRRCERGRKDVKGEKEKDELGASSDWREGGDEWMWKPCRASEAQPRSSETGRPAVCVSVRRSVCGCLCVRTDQQLGESAGVSAWLTGHFLFELTLPSHIDTHIQRQTLSCTWSKVSGNLQTVFPIMNNEVSFQSSREAEGNSNEIQDLLLILQQTAPCQQWHNS